MDKTKTVAIICIVGFVVVLGVVVYAMRDRIFAKKDEVALPDAAAPEA